MRGALHLHLFYPDIALELIDRVARLGRADIDVLVTHVAQLPDAVEAALDRLPGIVVRTEVPNAGWDIGPLFALLPLIRARGYDVVGKLHTKKGNSGYAAEWREIALDAMIGSHETVEQILGAFAARPDLALVGPELLYKSTASHMFRNAELLSELAPALVRPMYPPADWGFFAGTFFWARTELLEKVATLADTLATHGEGDEADGAVAHALERLFGLAPLAVGGALGLAGEQGLTVVSAPGAPSHEPIVRTLVRYSERAAGAPDAELVARIRDRNPLVDYILHGRDPDALDPNPYFSSEWYNRIHADVFGAGMHPLYHYTHHGATEGRSTGPLFDGLFYRTRYRDVSGDPLRHFLETGSGEDRVAIPVTVPEFRDDAERPRRFYRQFDIGRETLFLRDMAQLEHAAAERAASLKVSVIMPAYNREATIAAAIRSVLGQSHKRFELIIVDDGSSDGTRTIAEQFTSDPRVRLIAGSHSGVSGARNLGLEAATGDVLAYLDSDNRWTSWFLEVMTRFIAASGAEAAYSGIALRDDLGHLTGYRGDDFDWAACLERNYVDLNAFVHRRGIVAEIGGFDTRLRRMVDWDLILRIGKVHTIGYAPFVGCEYHDGRDDPGRITTSEPVAFQKLVETKNRTGHAIGSPAFNAALKLAFAIKIAAPEREKEAWGDYHFADSLARAIERLGHRVRIDFREGWTGHALADEDVAIVLRGLIPYTPRPGQITLLWNISHPDQVPYEEYDAATRIYAASPSHAALLGQIVDPPVTTLLQATDPQRFHPAGADPDAPPVMFCGNSRGVERDIVRWAIEADHPPVIYGDGWDGLIPAGLVAARNIDNHVLGRLYAGASVVLNDHWPSMRAFGIVSNRLFDIAAAGGRAVSDPVASIPEVFGDIVAQVDGVDATRQAIEAALAMPRNRDGVAEFGRRHSFDARAAVLLADVQAMLGLAPASRPVPAAPAGAMRVHIVAPYGRFGPQSSTMIRLVAPLTDTVVADAVSVTVGAAAEPLPDHDICIVQRAALPSVDAVNALVRDVGQRGATLVADVDDAFTLIGEDHPEAAIYRPLNAALDRVIGAAAETWFSTRPLAEAYRAVAHRHAILSNALDPRLWRDWRSSARAILDADRVRMLYMGTHTHGEDFAMIRPALDRLHAERRDAFSVTLIGVTPDVAPAPWLSRLSPPAEAITYPRFVRWLRAQGPFDVGLAPLADTPFNRCKSDVKLLDYAALGLLPVASDGPAYRADPETADLAILTEDWFEALRAVIDDRDGHRAKAAAAAEHVWRRRSVAQIAPRMLARLRALLAA